MNDLEAEDVRMFLRQRTAAVWGRRDQPQRVKLFSGTDKSKTFRKRSSRKSFWKIPLRTRGRPAAAGPPPTHSRGPRSFSCRVFPVAIDPNLWFNDQMSPQHNADWERFCRLPFRLGEKYGQTFRRLLETIEITTNHPDNKWLELMKNWMLMPFSLWRNPYHGQADFMCDVICRGERLDPQMLFMLDLMQDLPSQEEQDMIIAHERGVEQGLYEDIIPGKDKYDPHEQALFQNAQWQSEYRRMGKLFDIDKMREPKRGVVRREMVQERNFRGKNWVFDWSSEESRFNHVFTNFCLRWILYGIEGNKPLLQKLTVNATAIGWIMYWPVYWSPDPRRDINWRGFNKNQRARGVQRQGAKMTSARLARQQQAILAYEANREAARLKLKGEKRIAHIRKGAKLSASTDRRVVLRLVSEGAELAKQKKRPAAAASAPDSKPKTINERLAQAPATAPSKVDFLKAAAATLTAAEKAELAKFLAGA